MGNSQLVRILSDIGVNDIQDRFVTFQEGLLRAKAIFQRHNYQLYQVHCPEPDNPFGFDPERFNLTLRVIRCLNDDLSVQILKDMQQQVMSLPAHPNLIRFYIMAIVPEDFNQTQKAGLIGLPGLYKSVQGTTDYKNDTIQFILVEEDHLNPLPANFFADSLQPPPPDFEISILKQRFTLKQFLDRVLPNPLLVEFFSSDETIIYQLIVQSLTALAYLNSQGMQHQDLLPQNVIIELIGPRQMSAASVSQANEFTRKFRVKLGEYLKMKMLSDIAYQKSILNQMQAKVIHEQNMDEEVSGYERVQQLAQQLKDNKTLYSQYDPPEKLEKETVEVRLRKGADRSVPLEQARFEDFDISFKPVKLHNDSCDIYSLGIIILEIYLSLYVHKRDCKEMVHNLYLNKLSYQSRCILLNQILDEQKNPIICSLLKEMLRDQHADDKTEQLNSSPGSAAEDFKKNKRESDEASRPTAAQLLSRNRIVHYLAYISDNQIDDQYLPRDINLLQVFTTSEQFVPMLIKCGMQRILNRKKSIICFFSLMTLYVKNGKDFAEVDESSYNARSFARLGEKSRIQRYILDQLHETKAYLEIIELMTYCLSSDLRQVLLFFNQNLVDDEGVENLAMDAHLFKQDFLEQKQAGLECLLHTMRRPNIDLQKLVHESMSAGLMGLIILLTQFIKNQEWMRKQSFNKFVTLNETNQPLVLLTLELIETIQSVSFQGFSKTVGCVLDKSGFYLHLAKALFDHEETEQTLNIDLPYMRNKSNDRSEAHLNADQSEEQAYPGNFALQSARLASTQNAASNASNRMTVDEGQPKAVQVRLNTFKKVFRDRLIDFLQRNITGMSESTLKKIVELMLANDIDRALSFLQSTHMQQCYQRSSRFVKNKQGLKAWLLQTFINKFHQLHLHSSKNQRHQSIQKASGLAASSSRNAKRADIDGAGFLSRRSHKDERSGTRQTLDKHRGSHSGLSRYKKDSQGNTVNLDQTMTSNKSQDRSLTHQVQLGKRVRSHQRLKTQRSATATSISGPMSETERRLCEISKLIMLLVDSEAHQRTMEAIQKCVQTQTCLSSETFATLAGYEKYTTAQQASPAPLLERDPYMKRPETDFSHTQTKKRRDPNANDNYSHLQRTTVAKNYDEGKSEKRSQTQHDMAAGVQYDTMSRTRPDQNSLMDPTDAHNKSLQVAPVSAKEARSIPEVVQSLTGNLFFKCEQCDDKVFCLVCAIKFHQDHKNVRCTLRKAASSQPHQDLAIDESMDMTATSSHQLVCHSEQIEQYLQNADANFSLQEASQLRSQLNYCDKTFLWKYEPDQFVKQSSAVQQQMNTPAHQLLEGLSKMEKRRKRPNLPIPDNSLLNAGSTHQSFRSRAFLNLDIFNRNFIRQENETHFINIDAGDQQHALISSTPLETVDPIQLQQANPRNSRELFDSQRQSYFEIAIHSSGFSDQVQIGVLFMNERDVLNGLSTSSDLSNTLNNLSMIVGYEPLSIGYHGDDGCIYNNLSQDVSIDHLIKRAQTDAEALLVEAETNAESNIFDINNQQVYGGLYGPPFGSGDHVGVGIVPINLLRNVSAATFNSQSQQEYAIYFTVNGICLPAVKLSSNNLRMFPVVSFKGKLCHIEVVQDADNYRFNRLQTQRHEDEMLQQSMLHNEKFMRSLTQFDQILTLKSRRMSYSTTAMAGRNHSRGALANDQDESEQTRQRDDCRTEMSHTEQQVYQYQSRRLAAHKLLNFLQQRDKRPTSSHQLQAEAAQKKLTNYKSAAALTGVNRNDSSKAGKTERSRLAPPKEKNMLTYRQSVQNLHQLGSLPLQTNTVNDQAGMSKSRKNLSHQSANLKKSVGRNEEAHLGGKNRSAQMRGVNMARQAAYQSHARLPEHNSQFNSQKRRELQINEEKGVRTVPNMATSVTQASNKNFVQRNILKMSRSQQKL